MFNKPQLKPETCQHGLSLVIAMGLLTTAFAHPLQANGTYECKELERISLAAEGSMRPVYEGRAVTFTWNDQGFSGNGVFYHKDYAVTKLGENSFRASAENEDRSDLFRFEDGILLHAAIVKYGREPSIQSQVFECQQVE